MVYLLNDVICNLAYFMVYNYIMCEDRELQLLSLFEPGKANVITSFITFIAGIW